jgi:hypothetical protein
LARTDRHCTTDGSTTSCPDSRISRYEETARAKLRRPKDIIVTPPEVLIDRYEEPAEFAVTNDLASFFDEESSVDLLDRAIREELAICRAAAPRGLRIFHDPSCGAVSVRSCRRAQ